MESVHACGGPSLPEGLPQVEGGVPVALPVSG